MGYAILCVESIVGDESFAILLADDFLTQQSGSSTSNVTDDLKNAFERSGQTQLSVTQLVGLDISK